MEEKDVPSATRLLNNYLKNFSLRPIYDEKEVSHWFISRNNVINSYVIEVNFSNFTFFYKKKNINKKKTESTNS